MNNSFYSELPLHKISVNRVLAEESLFHKVPDNWHVIITDIKGSTIAVQSGLQQVVNLIATGSIIAALNIGKEKGISVPFFFGGDGATLLVPPSILDITMQALTEHSINASNNYNLDLRVGQVSVRAVYQNNQTIQIAKVCLGQSFAIPIVLGNGLKYAEKLIKANESNIPNPTNGEAILNLEGMECRWDQVKPPASSHEIVCLLVEVMDASRHSELFKKTLDIIDQIYGSEAERNPISISKLKLKATPERIIKEMRTKLGKFKWAYLIKYFLLTYFGFIYFRFNQAGKTYLQKLVELSDTLVIDGRINTVITGSAQNRHLLTKALEELESTGAIYFGIYACKESVISCYVRNRDDQHIHFVDGEQGGYTQAAKMLKRKIKEGVAKENGGSSIDKKNNKA